MDSIPKLELNNGLAIPQLGFGTADIGSSSKTQEVVVEALKVGFRRFDTATLYGNESDIGKAMIASDVDRDDMIIATKLWNSDFGKSRVETAFNKSLSNLKLDFVDIYMQHWPVQGKRIESWEVMEELYKEGKIKGLGVSNFTVRHLEELQNETSIPPVMNQVEFSPFLFQEELLRYCEKQSIILEAYSPFAKGRKLDDPELIEIAQKYHKTTAQIILRWCIQLGISVIPKASSPNHIRDNIDIFDFQISDKDMSAISSKNSDYRIEWDPTDVV